MSRTPYRNDTEWTRGRQFTGDREGDRWHTLGNQPISVPGRGALSRPVHFVYARHLRRTDGDRVFPRFAFVRTNTVVNTITWETIIIAYIIIVNVLITKRL